MTRTYSVRDAIRAAYEEIFEEMMRADYEHALIKEAVDTDFTLDMHGIGIRPKPVSQEKLEERHFHIKEVPYSSVVGSSFMVTDASGACVCILGVQMQRGDDFMRQAVLDYLKQKLL